jgi:hypothetical protein
MFPDRGDSQSEAASALVLLSDSINSGIQQHNSIQDFVFTNWNRILAWLHQKESTFD